MEFTSSPFHSTRPVQDAAYEIRLLVFYNIDEGYLDDGADVDPDIRLRAIMNPLSDNFQRFRYRPFCPLAIELRIAPTSLEYRYGVAVYDEEEEGETIIPSTPKPYDGRAYAQRMERQAQAVRPYLMLTNVTQDNLAWLLYLRKCQRSSVDSQAIDAGLDPSKLSTHTALDPAKLKKLDRIAEILALKGIRRS